MHAIEARSPCRPSSGDSAERYARRVVGPFPFPPQSTPCLPVEELRLGSLDRPPRLARPLRQATVRKRPPETRLVGDHVRRGRGRPASRSPSTGGWEEEILREHASARPSLDRCPGATFPAA